MAAKKAADPADIIAAALESVDAHGPLADALALAAKSAGGNDVVAGRIRREATQFLARAVAILKGAPDEPSVGSAPPVSSAAAAAQRAAPLFDTVVVADAFDPATEQMDTADGARIGFRVNAAGNIAMVAIKQVDGVMPREVFGERPALAYRLVSTGQAVLVDRSSLKVIRAGR